MRHRVTNYKCLFKTASYSKATTAPCFIKSILKQHALLREKFWHAIKAQEPLVSVLYSLLIEDSLLHIFAINIPLCCGHVNAQTISVSYSSDEL